MGSRNVFWCGGVICVVKDQNREQKAEIDYPVEAIIETAIASFLDTDALSFADCKPERGQ